MSDIIIRVDNIGKKYLINHKERDRYVTLRDVITEKAKQFSRHFSSSEKYLTSSKEEFWALNNLSFEIKKGDVVGIIGHNGAGKSTLLKVLSRITEPTTGFIELRGRVASLLEVGTGFHPELTGRENIFLNGAILGMSKVEISRKFDEIVHFAEVEKFLDTAVKRYSSGMYVRLAFSVAAHLEPEILVVDEVLAVGDIDFQNKCFGKMNDVAKEGRTVLVVSHNMSAIQHLCKNTMHISHGRLIKSGKSDVVIQNYLDSFEKEFKDISLKEIPRKNGLGELIRIIHCGFLDPRGRESRKLLFGSPFTVYIEAIASASLRNLTAIIQIDSFKRDTIVTTSSEFSLDKFDLLKDERVSISAIFRDLYLMPGKYWITVSIRQGKLGLDQVRQARSLEISEVSYPEAKPHPGTWGYIQAFPTWDTNKHA